MAKLNKVLSEKRYCIILQSLLVAFALRVFAQALQFFRPTALLPEFNSWQSGVLPYPLLLASQVLILIFLCTSIRKLRTTPRQPPQKKQGKILFICGSVYFIAMLVRGAIGLITGATEGWFAAYLPVFFHLVLASFLLVLGHYKYFKK